MRDIFWSILDLIVPPRTQSRLLRSETEKTFLRLYNQRTIESTITLSFYQSPLIQAAITANKFYRDTHASKLLASLLSHFLTTLPDLQIILVPIPLSPERYRDRGYNQVAEVLKHVSQQQSLSVSIAPLLTRTIHTAPQTTLGRAERLKNVVGAFSIDTDICRELPSTACIIIIDDVTTTGTTLREATKLLQKNLPSDMKIVSLALAH